MSVGQTSAATIFSKRVGRRSGPEAFDRFRFSKNFSILGVVK